MRGISILFCLGVLACPRAVEPAILYVSPSSPNPASPYSSWNSAAHTIQDAVDVAQSNDVVLVTNGVYATGSRVVFYVMANRVAITNAITVRSVNGPAVTVIQGAGPMGNSAVRCAYVGTNAVLSGFTLTGGSTRTNGMPIDMSGAGARCESSAILSNCVLSGNSAYLWGGGVYMGTLNNCGIFGNTAIEGGGAFNSTCYSCTLAGNSASSGLGGSEGGTFYNCIVYFNAGANYSGASFQYSCTTPSPGGTGNITNDPLFVNAAVGNYHLSASSPCIDHGNNAFVQETTDLDGNPRIINNIVDMGAYESPFVTHYVSLGCKSPAAPYTNWFTAATNIQAAIDAAVDGETVLVTNGVYATGGVTNYPSYSALTNRVAIYKSITVRSVNGPSVTTIQGAEDPLTTNGDAAVRCLYMTNGASLAGFTLTNGATRGISTFDDSYGGGVSCQSTAAVISNCVISGNSAMLGGGVNHGALYNCILSGNAADYEESYGIYTDGGGGGAYESTLYNCIVTGNSGSIGGGAFMSTLYNCVISGNSAVTAVGVFQSTLYNCIAYFNGAGGNQNYINSSLEYCCTKPNPGGTGNITNDPQFVNAAAGDYHLSVSSPCIDRGNNAYAHGTTDLDGNPRIAYGVVDMGAYEAQFPVGYWAWVNSITNGLTNLTDIASGDVYPNLLKYATGSCPTNPDNLAAVNGSPSNGWFSLCFNHNTNAADVTLIVEGTYALTGNIVWSGIATNFNCSWGDATNVVEAGTTNPLTVTVSDTDLTGPVTNRYLRLHVTRP